jgi:hypothetical protein
VIKIPVREYVKKDNEYGFRNNEVWIKPEAVTVVMNHPDDDFNGCFVRVDGHNLTVRLTAVELVARLSI